MNTPTTPTSDSVQAHAAQEPQQKRGNDKAREAIEQASDELVYIPLSKLVHSPFNVRKSGGESVSELAALIKWQGLLQNLIIIPHTNAKVKQTAKFGVVAGGRRLRALNLLVEAGDMPAHEEILCKVITKEEALAASARRLTRRQP